MTTPDETPPAVDPYKSMSDWFDTVSYVNDYEGQLPEVVDDEED